MQNYTKNVEVTAFVQYITCIKANLLRRLAHHSALIKAERLENTNLLV